MDDWHVSGESYDARVSEWTIRFPDTLADLQVNRSLPLLLSATAAYLRCPGQT